MKLKGGVIIIGSLIWDPDLNTGDNLRKKWREQYLLPERIMTQVPIRYGRISKKRDYAYTMVFSKSCEKTLGKGIILEFKEHITSFEVIEKQAIALAIAEGIYKKGNLRITSNWASVGLLINPNLQQKDFAAKELIEKKWTDIFIGYRDTFIAESYKAKEESESVIKADGFLTINWQNEMHEFDLLIATPVIPTSNSIPSPAEIAESFRDNQNYFFQNRENQIYTSLDEDILNELGN